MARALGLHRTCGQASENCGDTARCALQTSLGLLGAGEHGALGARLQGSKQLPLLCPLPCPPPARPALRRGHTGHSHRPVGGESHAGGVHRDGGGVWGGGQFCEALGVGIRRGRGGHSLLWG